MERAAAKLEVAETDRLAAQNTEDHQHPDRQKDDNGNDFDNGKPVFRFPIAACRQKVKSEHQQQEQKAPEDGRAVREPVLNNYSGSG
ncbi:hypothetical protein D3C79_1005820 [compost metagenome]